MLTANNSDTEDLSFYYSRWLFRTRSEDSSRVVKPALGIVIQYQVLLAVHNELNWAYGHNVVGCLLNSLTFSIFHHISFTFILIIRFNMVVFDIDSLINKLKN